MEVVADGLPLFGGIQLAFDTTLVSLNSNGVQAVMGCSWRWQDVGKNGPTQNSLTAATTGRVWWFWRRRCGGWGRGEGRAGLTKRYASELCWPRA